MPDPTNDRDDQHGPEPSPPSFPFELTVIVPARNEEDCLRACLVSLTAQSEDIFLLGQDWELIVVDDGSTCLLYTSS